jgi:hypothetical protein
VTPTLNTLLDNLESKGILICQKSTPPIPRPKLITWLCKITISLPHTLPHSCLRLPDITATYYEIRPSTIQSLPVFLGLTHENPYDFLSEFQTICSTIRLTGFTEDALRMRLFPVALKERAKHWFQSLEPDFITSWGQLQQVFLKKYFPIGRTNDTRRVITSISQYEGETFHETWERLKDLLRSSPHHAVPKWQLM